MRKLFFAAIMLLSLNIGVQAQIVRDGKTFTVSNKHQKAKADTLITAFEFQDSKGTKYPIIINKVSGRCYVWKTSSKTGKLYKQYMKEEVSREIAKELQIAYKEKSNGSMAY